MTTNWCRTKYYDGGKFERSGIVRYLNRIVKELEEDVDRMSYWTLLGTIKYLGYDISKSFKVYYLECGKTLSNRLKELGFDNDVLELADEMKKNNVVDIYIESLHVDNESQLPDAFMQLIDIDDDTTHLL